MTNAYDAVTATATAGARAATARAGGGVAYVAGDDEMTCCRDTHLRHCHGTWVIHADGTQECSDVTCSTPGEAHAVVVLCAELEPVCRCR